MNKREFLAMGGAVPLILAGCGGSGSGSAPVRLLNASVGYPKGLGFMDESNQAVTGVDYGKVSDYANVQAGTVDVTLTVDSGTGTPESATSALTRTINKDTRYTLVAYGFPNELKPLLIAESTVTPDTGKANVNALNTSVDIGAVDVYLSTTKDLSVATQIASGVQGGQQSAFTGVLAGSYYVTVVGANSIAEGISDVRFQSPTPITLTALQVLTIVLTPGNSGTLANAIMLTQGTQGTATSFLNTTARVRAITATGGLPAAVAGVLPSTTTSQYSNYVVVNTGTPPTVTVSGQTVTPFMYVKDSTGAYVKDANGNLTTGAATLEAGGDYTMMVYVDASNNAVAQLVQDNNTAPVLSQGVKYRLVNLAYNNQGLLLSMSVNAINVASLVPYGLASDYREIPTPQNVTSVAEVLNGSDVLVSHPNQQLIVGNIFTDFIVSVDPNTGVAKDIFRAASGT